MHPKHTLVWLLLWGCQPEESGPGPQPEAEGDADADTDSDSDSDADSDLDGDGFEAGPDCDDQDALVFPGAPEHCGDGRITDCERTSEDGLASAEGVYSSSDLQDVLDMAPPGGTVHLCAGSWTGNFIADDPLHLVGHGGADQVELVGAQQESVLRLTGDSSLEGLTLRGGDADRGGGLRVTTEGTLTVTDCVIRDNQASYGGGVSLVPGVQASFPGTLFTANSAMQSGGGLYAFDAVIDLTGATVEGNRAYGNGGGVSLSDADLTGGVIQDNEVLGTSIFVGGGGVDASYGSTLTDVIITGNRSGASGGGLYLEGNVTVSGGSITDNVAEGPYWADGGGISTVYSDVVIEGTEILRNTASYGGGLSTSGPVQVVDCAWDDNSPTDVYHYEVGEFDAPATFACTEQNCNL